ncbi:MULTISPECIES: hypothetical protein [unclassified Streptomyces]|uniref:hypothetical protein n=1 Tax=unclassified Streptomyces TaxID=2593676 RepID=UPI0034317DF2
MGQCPQCGGGAEPDPERSGVAWCLACWHSWTVAREPRCPGRLPTLNAALRALADHRHLSR